MNTSLQNIKDDIQADINSKHNPAANPLLVRAQDEAAILNDIVDAVDVLYAQIAPPPAGVEWVTAPGAPTFGAGTISETASVLKVNGADRNVDAATLSQPLAATGMHRIDLTVVHYDPETLDAEYELIQGAEVANTETAVAPAIGADRVLVRTMLVKQSGAPILTPTFYANSASINGGASVFPDVTGKLNLTIDETNVPAIAANTTAIAANTAAIADKANKTLSIAAPTGNYVLTLADAAGMVRMNVATANTLTVPPNASVAFPVGTQIVLSQAGAGQTTVVAGSGVTVNSSGGKVKLAGQYTGATLIKVDTDTWTLFGNLTA